MIINKTVASLTSQISLAGFTSSGTAQVYRYSAANSGRIVITPLALDQQGAVMLPAYSISLLVIEAH